jgi:hypothetical protein
MTCIGGFGTESVFLSECCISFGISFSLKSGCCLFPETVKVEGRCLLIGSGLLSSYGEYDTVLYWGKDYYWGHQTPQGY